ncbi:MAG: NAD(P)-dependent alcohol dehydrogenase [Chitinophagaceae bacterium]|nr:MAG: NAD(P)-dependent alcohol dehydrogenase [Chitinophagaceae bacterium]
MKAATRTKYGSPEVLSINTLGRIPHPKRDEILVKVKATTVNRTDCSALTGKPWIIRCFLGLFKPRLPITGTDFSGVVVARGDDVTDFEINDDVYGFFDQGIGSHASYVCVSIKKAIVKKPINITYEQAAASLEGAHYAYYFLDKVNIRVGDRVLINGATGAIGNAALQFLKYKGANVTVTCPTAFVEVVKSLGADRVVDYTRDDFTKLDEQFDFVFDAVGKSSFGKCKSILKPNGIYISSELGDYCQNPLLALMGPFMRGKKVKFPIPYSIHRSMAFTLELMQQGKFIPLIDRRYSLEEIADAFSYVLTGEKKGNVIITFS